MNIFVLDKNPLSAAHQMCDKHIPKMIVESAQMLCTAHRICDPIGEYLDLGKNGRKIKRWKHENDLNASKPTLYKAAMINHPCNVWLRESVQNYTWLSLHAMQLLTEFKQRFENNHKSSSVIRWCAVNAYRSYYVGDKARFAKWEKKNNEPYWWKIRIQGSHKSYA